MRIQKAFFFNRHSLVILTLMLFFYSNKAVAQKNKKTNFVIIMADDLGYNDISCYGSSSIQTPNLDKLAAEGIRFTDFHSNGTVCSPTRASIITGKYQQRTGITGVVTAKSHRHVGLSLDEITFAEALKENGYTTGMFGKWHIGYNKKYNPIKQGFDEFKGYVSGNVDYHAHIDQEGHFDWWNQDNLKDDKGYSTDLITAYGVDFIKRNKDKPFLLYLPHESPHGPFQRRLDRVLRVENDPGEDPKYREKLKNKDSILSIRKEMIEVMDEGIGSIINTLKAYGLDKNTLVLFCSDNGAPRYGSNKPLKGWKGSVFEGGHRVPAIAWWPSTIFKGKEIDQTLLTMDIYPTLLDISNTKKKSKLDGISFKKVLLENKKIKMRRTFWEYKGVSAVRFGDYKLMSFSKKGKNKLQLFNLKKDISEKENIASKHPKLVKSMEKALKNWKEEVHTTPDLTAKN